MSDNVEITFAVNGVQQTLVVEPRHLLVDVLRDRLSLTGTHIGCGYGVCGACTVMVDGVAVRSCITLAVQASGRSVTTVEGLAAPGGELTPLQQAFSACRGLQCGFCTPGVLMSLTALSMGDDAPTDEEITDTVGGHLCRCTGYSGMLAAARVALRRSES